MMQTFCRRATAFFCAIAVSVAVAGMAMAGTSMGGVPSGVGGNPPTEFELVEGMFNVGSETNPIPISIDPTAPPWPKQFVIPPGTTIVPGQVFPVWESLILFPPDPSGSTGIPRLPLTDWHEEIHEDPTGLPFAWGPLSHLVVHEPGPTGGPLVDVPGGVSPDGKKIWFGPFPGIVPTPNGLPVWIHKELVYTGQVTITPSPNPIFIHVWEHPTVPEPAALALLLIGSSALALIRRRR